MNKLFVDIGGQSVKYKINNEELKTFSTTNLNKESLLNEIANLAKDSKVTEIFISSPGAVNSSTGYLLGHSGIRDYNDFNLYDELKNKMPFIKRIYALNDANAALAGFAYENSKIKNAALVSIGTGIGGALMINGKPVIGKNGMAGEFGYLLNEKSIASTLRLLWAINKELNKNFKSLVEVMSEINIEELPIFDKWIDEISDICKMIYFNFDPECIFISGGVSHNKMIVRRIEKATNAKLYVINSDFNVEFITSSEDNIALLGLKNIANKL